MLKFYGYKKCSTSNKAEKFLKENLVPYEFIDITVQIPSKQAFKIAINLNPQKKSFVFNTSGVIYREKQIKNILPNLNETELIDLLSSDSKLIKRPFLHFNQKITVGFNAIDFKNQWLSTPYIKYQQI